VSGGYSGNALQVTPASNYGTAYQSFTASSGMLLRNSCYLKAGTEASFLAFIVQDGSWTQLNWAGYVLPSVWTQYVVYVTETAGNTGVYQSYGGATAGKTSLFNTASAVQVLV